MTARTIGVAIVCAPLASALLLGLGWAVQALVRTIRDRSSK